MNRNELTEYIKSLYSVAPDYPWKNDSQSAVFRHIGNRKWFAVILTVRKSAVGADSEELIDIVNLKCDKTILGTALMNKGFYPAYHMNKENWITVALDGSADDENIKFFLDLSFELTAPKVRKTQPHTSYE